MKLFLPGFVVSMLLIITTTAKKNKTLPHVADALNSALRHTERTIMDTILSDAEFDVLYHGAPVIPLDDLSFKLENIALLNLTNLQIKSSPFVMNFVSPSLRFMNLHVIANISKLEITGNYSVSLELMNFTSREIVSSNKGGLNLTFQNLAVSGLVGFTITNERPYIHTVALTYIPMSVSLIVHYKDGQGNSRTAEESTQGLQNDMEEPIYQDLADRLNGIVKEHLNDLLINITVPDLLDSDNDAEIVFKNNSNVKIGNINEFVDTIINITRKNFTDKVKIPNQEKTFEIKITFFKATGRFVAEEGWFRSLQTLHRTSDIIFRRLDDSFEISAALGLSTLEFGYKRYSVKAGTIGLKGELKGSVGENSVSFRIKIRHVNATCVVTLEELKVRDLKSIKMGLTGLRPFNWILSKFATYIVNRSRDSIIRNIELVVGNAISSKLEGFDCSNYFPATSMYI